VEMTAYALMTLVARSDLENAIPVLRWLISQQNSKGGFSSTQDTVIGIQALGALAQRISTTTVSLNVKFNYKADDKELDKQMRIDSSNAIVLQRIEMPLSTKYIEIEATGFGAAIVQVSWQYNLAVSAEQPAFFLNPQRDKISTENYLQLSVCTQLVFNFSNNLKSIYLYKIKVFLKNCYYLFIAIKKEIRQIWLLWKWNCRLDTLQTLKLCRVLLALKKSNESIQQMVTLMLLFILIE
jgi:hypothetical protein